MSFMDEFCTIRAKSEQIMMRSEVFPNDNSLLTSKDFLCRYKKIHFLPSVNTSTNSPLGLFLNVKKNKK